MNTKFTTAEVKVLLEDYNAKDEELVNMYTNVLNDALRCCEELVNAKEYLTQVFGNKKSRLVLVRLVKLCKMCNFSTQACDEVTFAVETLVEE